ncbi:hypothetical protein [Paenibacillus periandrae]|uniref:hypothetical protein n=1 Tax=Paenibacillus periandrae TaxID=1761741 RepID=UPI001F090D7D|nr:hypothetical protein [Paenibacillus periandrae]
MVVGSTALVQHFTFGVMLGGEAVYFRGPIIPLGLAGEVGLLYSFKFYNSWGLRAYFQFRGPLVFDQQSIFLLANCFLLQGQRMLQAIFADHT